LNKRAQTIILSDKDVPYFGYAKKEENSYGQIIRHAGRSLSAAVAGAGGN
jgi:hypothetical protein